MLLKVPPGFGHVEWFGKGPFECYQDRKVSLPAFAAAPTYGFHFCAWDVSIIYQVYLMHGKAWRGMVGVVTTWPISNTQGLPREFSRGI